MILFTVFTWRFGTHLPSLKTVSLSHNMSLPLCNILYKMLTLATISSNLEKVFSEFFSDNFALELAVNNVKMWSTSVVELRFNFNL